MMKCWYNLSDILSATEKNNILVSGRQELDYSLLYNLEVLFFSGSCSSASAVKISDEILQHLF